MIPVQFFTGMGSFWNGVLNGLAWFTLLGIPILIILLYFLKLKRRPLEVPSTYLWRRTIEDLHVNSLWQKLKKNWLLFLQLLLMALIILACLQPGWEGAELEGQRFIVLIDTSGSMNAADVSPTRLERAKQRAKEDIDRMGVNAKAMIISFSDIARVEQSFTDSNQLLKLKVDKIQPTNRSTNIKEALVAAAALANPERTSADATDVQAAEAMPATLLIYSDGGLPPVRDFSLGNLEPRYFPIANLESPGPRNIGIVAFSAERNLEKLNQLQAFGRLENFSDEDVTVEVELQLNGKFHDAKQLTIEAHSHAGAPFELSNLDLENMDRAELTLLLHQEDDLSLDNIAYAAINPSRQARVLVVTSRNDSLNLALTTGEAVRLAVVKFADVGVLADEKNSYYKEAGAGVYDLIIYDRCVPKEMPAANTLFIGAIPPALVIEDASDTSAAEAGGEVDSAPASDAPKEQNEEQASPTTIFEWSASPKQGPPLIIDIDRAHPLMQFIDLSDVAIIEGFAVKTPRGGANLIDADIGPLLAIAPRSGFEDAVLGFDIITQNKSGAYEANTNWPARRSFPVFFMNAIRYLGGSRGARANLTVKPGQPIALRASAPLPQITVKSPSGDSLIVKREGKNQYHYNRTGELGFYSVYEGPDDNEKNLAQQFTVNLFDNRESNLTPGTLDIEHTKLKVDETAKTPVRKELWKLILMTALVVLAAEWGLYLFRVYR